jgi:hypothetical protein
MKTAKKMTAKVSKMSYGGKPKKMQSGGNAVLVKPKPKNMSFDEAVKAERKKTVKDKLKEWQSPKKMMNGGYGKKKMK